MSNSLQVYPDGNGGFCLESIDIALKEYYKSDEVKARGLHSFRSSRLSGERINHEAMTDLFGRKISDPYFAMNCEEKIMSEILDEEE